MRSDHRVMEQITLRRANVVDADKVRYRVYSSPTEFVAVIAESALMAVKASGIKTPHKIVRDLPAEGMAIEAKKMAARDDTMRVAMPLQQSEVNSKKLMVDIPVRTEAATAPFVAMGIADLQHKGGTRARILPPEMVHQIIEEHVKAVAAEPPAPAPSAPAAPAAIAEPTPESIIAAAPTEPELSQAEKLVKMADETLPPTPTATTATPSSGEELHPDEVKKLLNE